MIELIDWFVTHFHNFNLLVAIYHLYQFRYLGHIIMRPSSLGGGRIMRRTLSVRLSVCLSVCLSVRPVIVAIGHDFSAHASVKDVLFGTH